MFEVIKNTDTFFELIALVDKSNLSNSLKWKGVEGQVVIKTDNFYYKVYQMHSNQKYCMEIREKLAQLYTSWGIHWKIITVEKDNFFYQIEQRQPLKVCQDVDEDAITQAYRDIINQLERLMHFDFISIQLKQYLKFKYFKLCRECLLKSADYAWFKDKIVLLDDSDFFIGLLDEQGNAIYTKPLNIQIQNKNKEPIIFGPINLYDTNLVECEEVNYKYMLYYPTKTKDTPLYKNLKAERDRCFESYLRYTANIQQSIPFFKQDIYSIEVNK
jgi:hypothetical protein